MLIIKNILFLMKKYAQTPILFILSGTIIVLIIFSKEAKTGAISGINLCENIIIPSLLPILIISNTLIRLKKNVFFSVFFGLISGYPSGIVLTDSLYKEGVINISEAKRLISYNFSGGCAFIISAVGTVIYKSTKAGIILFSSCVLSNVIIAVFQKPAFIFKKREIPNRISLNDALCSSVESSVKSLAVMSAYIILFSALLGIVKIPIFIIPIFEITNGICGTKLPLPICAFFLSFGGLCVHFQLLSFLNNMKIKYYEFFFCRLLSACLSYFICRIILCFFSNSALVSASLSPSLPFELSKLGGGLSMIMVIGCAVIVFDLENRKTAHNT